MASKLWLFLLFGVSFALQVSAKEIAFGYVGFEGSGKTQGSYWQEENGSVGLVDVKTSGGSFGLDDDGAGLWELSASEPYGVGRIQFFLDRKQVSGDLALVLEGDFATNGDFLIQLFDGVGNALAIDLFGETRKNMETVGTDTLAIPLMRYPQASRIDIRRLEGQMAFKGFWLMPILSQLDAVAETDAQLASSLGERLVAAGAGRQAIESGQMLTMPSLEMINSIGAGALAQAGYPRYRPLGLAAPKEERNHNFIPLSGTTHTLYKRAEKVSRLEIGNDALDSVKEIQTRHTSSNGVHYYIEVGLAGLRSGKTLPEIGFSSIPLSQNIKALFLETLGYPLIEFPIARDCIEVLVNQENPMEEISYSQLNRVFVGTNPAYVWGELGVADDGWHSVPLEVYGGCSSWGTSRVFQRLALDGEGWRKDMDQTRDVVFSGGVEGHVGKAKGGIGYATQRKRVHPVKVLAILPTDGSPAVYPDEASIYSGRYPFQRKLYAHLTVRKLEDASPQVRELVNLILSAEGQTLVVEADNLPLGMEEIQQIRAELGL
ncbi:MAG: PstS family phosphate ABC transporter substrate-binding protein [Puniceicoccaceae bacterium]